MNNIVYESNEDYKLRFRFYKKLLSLSYLEAVTHLLNKYGQVSDDYFREKSYDRFLRGRIKSIAKGKFSCDGLYVHHIFENQCINLTNIKYINYFSYKFEFQLKDNLVYVDLVEHLILHALIAKETSGKFGFFGYDYLNGLVSEWFTGRLMHRMVEIDGKKVWGYYFVNFFPKPRSMQLAYRRSYLKEEDAKKLLMKIKRELIDSFYDKLSASEKQNVDMPEWLVALTPSFDFKKPDPDSEWQNKYPLLSKHEIKREVPREKILKSLYDLCDSSVTFKEFKSNKIFCVRDELLEEWEKSFE